MNRRRANTIVAGLLASIIASISISEAQEPTKEDVLQKAAELAAERDRTEEALIVIVQSKGEDEAALKQKRKAVELLGQIGTSKSVPTLISILHKIFELAPDGVEITDHDDVGHIPPTPAMKALTALGPLSVEPLVNSLAQSPEDFFVRQTLGMLSCKELVAAVLADRIRQTKDEKIREKLEDVYLLEVDEVLRKSRDEKERAVKNTKGR